MDLKNGKLVFTPTEARRLIAARSTPTAINDAVRKGFLRWVESVTSTPSTIDDPVVQRMTRILSAMRQTFGHETDTVETDLTREDLPAIQTTAQAEYDAAHDEAMDPDPYVAALRTEMALLILPDAELDYYDGSIADHMAGQSLETNLQHMQVYGSMVTRAAELYDVGNTTT